MTELIPSGVYPSERKRLSRQCRAILERLRRGPATNRELATMALKYTSRLSDLRAAGYQVEVTKRNFDTGLTTYALLQRGQQELF